jgi:hypothetical protein
MLLISVHSVYISFFYALQATFTAGYGNRQGINGLDDGLLTALLSSKPETLPPPKSVSLSQQACY